MLVFATYVVRTRSTSKTGARQADRPKIAPDPGRAGSARLLGDPRRSLALLANLPKSRVESVPMYVFMPAGIANTVPYRVGCRLLLCCALTNYSGTSYREVIAPAI